MGKSPAAMDRDIRDLHEKTTAGSSQAHAEAVPAYPAWQLRAKRGLDILVAAPLLILLSPLWLIVVLWIKGDSPGPALFRQTRIGREGEPYTIYKFRTMIVDAERLMRPALEQVRELEGFVFQQKDDPRITRSGRLLRKTSLDELPQLLNILKGDMSLVGPRPEVPEIVRLYTPEQRLRLKVPPGVTGLAQVNGRSELTLGETMTYDLEYVRRWSLGLDLKILLKTVSVVFSGRGAY
ncbi:Bacterial sugar transferase [Acididesulfobacillus acetoxydans]|uniref:Bacterial sugar transferase n=1 Tax=Acididesulfobacillus acetoxydans TaxID=1561005 RepID=A0A8S0WVI6_9FIRM|nr:sugar transferase [Acididesulfobacillus acetoxydans]CAA7599621.1 Bacterial sugar transferase [Acididesulfobacillus acetoxydans]CEJ06468.1 Galactosyl transferase CpsE [Acididesulfobacillus acetoxydans]